MTGHKGDCPNCRSNPIGICDYHWQGYIKYLKDQLPKLENITQNPIYHDRIIARYKIIEAK